MCVGKGEEGRIRKHGHASCVCYSACVWRTRGKWVHIGMDVCGGVERE